MTTYSRTHSSVTVAAGEKIAADHLNAEFDTIFDALDTGGIGSTQIAASAITSSELAADAVTLAKLDNTMIIKSDETWADTNDTKIPTVKAIVAAIAAGSYEEDLSETTEASIFGAPTTTDVDGAPLETDVIYKVECDGFLTTTTLATRIERPMKIYMDDTEGTTFYVGQQTFSDTARYFHITIPVPKDYYWKLSAPEDYTINWQPIGSGGCDTNF